MSAIVERDPDAAWGVLSDLVAVRDRVQNYEIEFVKTQERFRVLESIHMVTFSDTMILFTKGDSDTELRCMIVLLVDLFHKALCACVPVRSGLSLGRFDVNLEKSMYAGPALIEAYRIGESAQWLGIALAQSVQDRAIALNMASGRSKVVVKWDLPVKGGTREAYVVNWPAIVAKDLNVTPPVSVAQFYQAFESTFGHFGALPTDVRAKYENTVLFMNALLANHVAA